MKKVILVGEEHSDTSHMKMVVDLVIQHLQNNKSVAVALEQNCGTKTIENLCDASIPSSRARSKVIENYKTANLNQLSKEELLELDTLEARNLSLELQDKYKKLFMSFDNTIQQNIDKFCINMNFHGNENHLDYAISLHEMAIYAFNNKKSLQFISVDTEDLQSQKSSERDIAMYKNIICSDADIVIYPVGSAHMHDEIDGDKRLAALLIKDPNIVLELANLYTTNNEFSYKTVQQDIENFKNLFNIKDIVVHDVKKEVLDEFFQSEEIKVKDEIVLKKPIFKVYKDKEFKGFNSINDHGLTLEDIEYNLKKNIRLTKIYSSKRD